MEHLTPNPAKKLHGVFNVQRSDVIGLVDDAWVRRGASIPNDPGAFVIPMGKTVGTAGETSIKIIVKPGRSEIITAYPVKQEKKMNMWCPRCDQGEIVKAKILATGESVRVCQECDALWTAGVEIQNDNFIDFSTFAKSKGLQGLWTELQVLERE